MDSQARLLDALTRLVESLGRLIELQPWLAFLIAVAPGLAGLRSIAGLSIGMLLGFAGATVMAFDPLWGFSIWALAWIAAGWLGARAARRRLEERRHRELLQAARAGRIPGNMP